MKRRNAIRLGLGRCGGGALGLGGIKSYQLYKRSDCRVLEGHQGLLDDLDERMITATDSPGAKDAGVGALILKMVRDCTDRKTQNNFIKGFTDLMDRTRKNGPKPFGECSLSERTAILTHFEEQGQLYPGIAGKLQHKLAGDSFFTTLKKNTILAYSRSKRGANYALPH